MTSHDGRQSENQAAVENAAAAPPGSKGQRRYWRLWFLLLCLVGSAGLSFVIFKYIAPRIPRELVGTWQVTKGNIQGATMEFHWYGTCTATLYEKGKKASTDYSVAVEGARIFLRTKEPISGKDQVLIQTIVSLTENELVMRDEDQVVYHMVRIRD